MYYVYIVECKDGTLYTGWTNDIDKRIGDHNAGKGAKYTRTRTPVKLRYFEEYTNQHDAMRREYEIKQLPRLEKLRLFVC